MSKYSLNEVECSRQEIDFDKMYIGETTIYTSIFALPIENESFYEFVSELKEKLFIPKDEDYDL